MTLCCIEDKNLKRALHFNEIVLKRDIRNPLALHYAQLIGNVPSPTLKKGDKNKASAAVSVKKTDSNPPLPGYKRKDRSSSVLEKHNMIAFVIGLVISALVILVLIVPALNEDKDAKIKELQTVVENYSGETNMTPEEVLECGQNCKKLQRKTSSCAARKKAGESGIAGNGSIADDRRRL